MPKIKFYLIGLLIVLGITLTSTIAYAERDYVGEFLNISKEDRIDFIKSLNEDELLAMGNQACIEDPTGEIVGWGVFHYGLGPIWEQSPPQASKYLSFIQDENLHPMWRSCLIGIMPRYIGYWNYGDRERLIDYIFEYLKNSKGEIVLRQGCAASLDNLTYKAMSFIVDSKELGIDEKHQRIDKLHLKSAAIIEYMVSLLQKEIEKDEQLLRRTVGTLRAFATRYLREENMPPVEYRTGKDFAIAVKAAARICPVFGQTLQRKDISVVLISHLEQALISLDSLDQIPVDFINSLRKDERFSGEKEQAELFYWEQQIREAREQRNKRSDPENGKLSE